MVDDIRSLIPQRDPIMMVDTLERADYEGCVTTLTVRPDNFFVEDDGLMSEPGLVEHIAQSASALAGFRALKAGSKQAPVGYIGEVRHFACLRRPAVGEHLVTTITMGPTVGEVTVVKGVTASEGEKVAETQMKIAIKDQ